MSRGLLGKRDELFQFFHGRTGVDRPLSQLEPFLERFRLTPCHERGRRIETDDIALRTFSAPENVSRDGGILVGISPDQVLRTDTRKPEL